MHAHNHKPLASPRQARRLAHSKPSSRSVGIRAIFIASVLGALGLGTARAQPQELTFVVDKNKVRLSAELTAANLTADGKATVVARGVSFDPPRLVDLKAPWQPDQSTPLVAVENYHRALVSGTDEAIVGFWYPDEQPGIAKELAIPDHNRLSREYFASLGKMPILCILDFPKNSVVLVSQGKLVVGVSTIEKDGKWYITNKRPNDLASAIAEAAFMDGTVKPKTQ